MFQGDTPLHRALLGLLHRVQGYDEAECQAMIPPALSAHDQMTLLALAYMIAESYPPERGEWWTPTPFGYWWEQTEDGTSGERLFYTSDEVWIYWSFRVPLAEPEGAELPEIITGRMTGPDGPLPAFTFYHLMERELGAAFVIWQVDETLALAATSGGLQGFGKTCAELISRLEGDLTKGNPDPSGDPVQFRRVDRAAIVAERRAEGNPAPRHPRRLPHTGSNHLFVANPFCNVR